VIKVDETMHVSTGKMVESGTPFAISSTPIETGLLIAYRNQKRDYLKRTSYVDYRKT